MQLHNYVEKEIISIIASERFYWLGTFYVIPVAQKGPGAPASYPTQ